MANYISEDQIEKAIICIFKKNLSYRHIDCLNEDNTRRINENDVVIKPLLREKLVDLNRALPEIAIDEGFDQLCQTRLDRSELSANREIYGLIRNGIHVTVNNKAGRKEPVTVKVIDLDDETKNDYLVVFDSAKRRISQLLDESIVAEKPLKEGETAANEKTGDKYGIKPRNR